MCIAGVEQCPSQAEVIPSLPSGFPGDVADLGVAARLMQQIRFKIKQRPELIEDMPQFWTELASAGHVAATHARAAHACRAAQRSAQRPAPQEKPRVKATVGALQE